MRRAALVVASLATAALLSSCGGGQRLSANVSAELEAHVQAVRAAAVDHDPARAVAQLTQLRLQVTQLEQQGQISSTKSKAILDDVAAVQAQLASVPVPPPPPTTLAPPPSTVAPSPPGHAPHSHGGDNGGDGGDH